MIIIQKWTGEAPGVISAEAYAMKKKTFEAIVCIFAATALLYLSGCSKEKPPAVMGVKENAVIPQRPPVEGLELTDSRTGFLEYRNINNNELLYQPAVLLKLKNIRKEEFPENVRFLATFISNGEEWATATANFRGPADTPLQPGIVRQLRLQCSVGYKSYLSVPKAEVRCVIYADDKEFKEVKIDSRILPSNRF